MNVLAVARRQRAATVRRLWSPAHPVARRARRPPRSTAHETTAAARRQPGVRSRPGARLTRNDDAAPFFQSVAAHRQPLSGLVLKLYAPRLALAEPLCPSPGLCRSYAQLARHVPDLYAPCPTLAEPSYPLSGSCRSYAPLARLLAKLHTPRQPRTEAMFLSKGLYRSFVHKKRLFYARRFARTSICQVPMSFSSVLR